MNAPAGLTAAQAVALRSAIIPGVTFDTPFESGCVATTAPDTFGMFSGRDSDGVLCSFCVTTGGMPLTITATPQASARKETS